MTAEVTWRAAGEVSGKVTRAEATLKVPATDEENFFLAGMVASTGPINTPFFIAYGLVKGAYLSTEVVGSIAVGLTKTIVFQRLNALSWETAARGLLIGSTVMAGSWVAKGFVLRLEAEQFRLLMDGLLVLAGLVLLWSALATGHA